MSQDAHALLMGQFQIACSLTLYHLETLTTEECLWRPAERGLHVWQGGDGKWRADWPEHEGYDLGPPSIGWLSWHLIFWWSMALDHNFARGELTREQIDWPGDAESVRQRILGLEQQWRTAIQPLNETDLQSAERTRWPIQDRPLAEVVAWANLELMKNAAEIGMRGFFTLCELREDVSVGDASDSVAVHWGSASLCPSHPRELVRGHSRVEQRKNLRIAIRGA